MSNREKFIEYMLENGKTHSWVELANKFNLAEGKSNKGKSDTVRMIWKGHTKSHKLENFVDKARITKVKRWQDGNGEWKESIHYSETHGDVDPAEALKKAFKDYVAPEPFTYEQKRNNENCAIINLFDAHMDKLCLLNETNEHSTIADNVARFERSFDELLAQCLIYEPETIYIPVGSDFFNTNDLSIHPSTKKGTPQRILGSQEDSFVTGINAYRRCIDKAAQHCNVICPVIKGNHDEDKVFYLGVALNIAYESNSRVTIDNTRHQRKYYKYGENLFGFAHGDKEKRKIDQLPLLMAEEQKHMWASTTYREWYMGDIHHKQEFKFLRAKDFVGCTVRFLRSVGTTDKWHHDAGYIGVPRTSEAFIWKLSGGLLANFQNHIE